MSATGLALVLTAALCHTIWNYFVKRINGGPELIWLFSTITLIVYLPLAIWIVVVEQPHFGLWQIGFVAGSTVLHLAYFLYLQVAYRHGDLSLIYPTARASGPLLSTALPCFIWAKTSLHKWQSALPSSFSAY